MPANPALAWLLADGSWRQEPRDEPELSAVVAMLSAFSNETGACEPVWREGKWIEKAFPPKKECA